MPGYLNGITGEYAPPAGYLVNEKEAEAFDEVSTPMRCIAPMDVVSKAEFRSENTH